MKNKILVSSILTIALCLSLIAGSTFALFTSESQVNVAVTSGKVNVVATPTAPEMGSTLGNALGTAKADGNSLTLENFVPGDYATFSIAVDNQSTVTVNYRTVISVSEDNGLASGLVVTIGGVEYKNSAKGKLAASAWTSITPEQGDDTISVVIALPETAGNEYQTKSCKITYAVEAIQGNVIVMESATDIHNSTTMSGTFQLTSDVKTSEYGADSRYGYGYEYIIRKQADYTLDLNGKTIYHDTVNENANKNALTYTLVANHAGTKLTIKGDGKVVSHNKEGYTCAVQGKDGTLITIDGGEFEVHNGIAVWAGAGAHIIINGGSFVNSDANTDHELIYSSGGVIDIYGGFFHNTDGHQVLNVEDRNRATGFINVYGGTFVNFNPTTGGQDPNNIKVADGYTVVEETQTNGDVWYIVVPVSE